MISPEGLVAIDHLTKELCITKVQLALACGVSRDSISKVARRSSPKTQLRLREVLEIINKVLPWAGTPLAAYAWYRSQSLPSFGDQTAEDLVKQGRAEAVKRYLSRISVGGYA